MRSGKRVQTALFRNLGSPVRSQTMESCGVETVTGDVYSYTSVVAGGVCGDPILTPSV